MEIRPPSSGEGAHDTEQEQVVSTPEFARFLQRHRGQRRHNPVRVLRRGAVRLRRQGHRAAVRYQGSGRYGHSDSASEGARFEDRRTAGHHSGLLGRGPPQLDVRRGGLQGPDLFRGDRRGAHLYELPDHLGHQIQQRRRGRAGQGPGRAVLALVTRRRGRSYVAQIRLRRYEGRAGGTPSLAGDHVRLRSVPVRRRDVLRVVAPGGAGELESLWKTREETGQPDQVRC
mmetsp:Transcript_21575/g.50735  ORF Transcript_21575/g.50735 Transcript_21575/m.50735 type:complete len:229 (+) Transcript_21575:1403-2089(+)